MQELRRAQSATVAKIDLAGDVVSDVDDDDTDCKWCALSQDFDNAHYP